MLDGLWQLGLALGLAIDAGLALALALNGVGLSPANIGQFFAVGVSNAVLATFGLPVLVNAFRASVGLFVAWDQWNHRNDAPAPAARAPADEPEAKEPVIDNTARANEQRRAHWDVFWQRLFGAGDAYGFTNSALTTDGSPTKVMTDDAWKKVMPYAVYSGLLIGGKPGRATKWAPNYNLERFEAEALWRQLPHPTFEPPEIVEGPYHATPPQPATTRATRTIEGVRAD